MYRPCTFLLLPAVLAQLAASVSLTGTAVTPGGAAAANAEIYLYLSPQEGSAYRSRSDGDGRFNLRGIASGEYVLQVTLHNLGQVLRIRLDSTDIDLGVIRLKQNPCGSFGVTCDDLSRLKREIPLPCLDKANPLRDESGSPVVLRPQDLRRRAIYLAQPDWDNGIAPPFPVSVYVVIDKKGRVVCSGVATKPDAWDEQGMSVARKCVFRPIIHRGRRVAVLGILEFGRVE